MKNIINFFEENNIFFTFKYYGIQDFASGWDIKAIIDNQKIFSIIYDIFPLEKIESKEEYFVYLFTDKIIKFEELIPNIANDSNKIIVRQVVDNAIKIAERISKGEIIKFINKNYSELFDEKLYTYEIPFITLDLIIRCISGINPNVIDYLIDNHKYLIINNFDEFERWFENNPSYFEKLFSNGKLKEYDVIHLDTILNIWEHILKKKKTNLKQYIESVIPALYLDIETCAKNATKESIIRDDLTIRNFYSFLKIIKSPLANKFSKYSKRARDLMEDYLKTSGQVYTYSIPVKEMVESWKKETEWEGRLLSTTHVLNKDSKSIEFVSRLSSIEHKTHPILDMVSTNISTNEIFTLSYQQDLSIQMNFNSSMFRYFISDQETLSDYISITLSAANFISEQMCEDIIFDDCQFLFDIITSLANNLEDEHAVRVLCYSSSMYICSLIEKLLRTFYKFILKDISYVPVEKATLGQLLTENNQKIVEVFGRVHVQNLAYFLSSVQPNDVGRNLRNSLAHWRGLNKQNMTVSLVARLLYLFTDVLNTIFWFFICNNRDGIEGESNDQL